MYVAPLTQCLQTPRPRGVEREMVPEADHESAWYEYVHGRPPPSEEERNAMAARVRLAVAMPAASSASDSEDEVDALLPCEECADHTLSQCGYFFSRPTTAAVHALSSDDALTVAGYLQKWILHPQFTASPSSPNAIHPIHAQWMLFVLARIDRQLRSDEIAALRQLARACIKAITRARVASTRIEDVLSTESGAWIALVAIAGAWGQWDLWHEAQARLRAVPAVPL